MHKNDVLALISRIVGYATIILGFVNTLPGHDTNPNIGIAILVLGFIIALGTDILRIFNVPAPPAGTAFVLTTSPDSGKVKTADLVTHSTADASPQGDST